MTKSAFITIVLGGLLSFGPAASAQPGPPDRPGQPARPAEAAQPAEPPRPGQPGQPQGPGQAPPPAAVVNPFATWDPNARPESNVVLEELVQRVAEESDREFLIHANVPTRIYLGGTLEETPTYPELVSILASNDLAVFESQGIVHIAHDSSARQFPSRVVQVDNESIPDDEIVTRVLTLPAGTGMRAAQLVPILRPMQPQYAHLTAMPGDAETASKLVIVDRYANVKRITEVIREIVGSVGL